MTDRLVIIGAGGHGRVIADIARNMGYQDIVFLDDSGKSGLCGGYPVVGTSKNAQNYMDSDFVVAIGNAAIRKKLQLEVSHIGCNLATLIHPKAVIAQGVDIGEGSVVMAGAVINPETVVGRGCIINTCSSVDHDCRIGDYVHIAVGAHVCGTATIGTGTWVGAGATIINNVDICGDCMIGAGATVIENLKNPGVYVGIPARKIKNKG